MRISQAYENSKRTSDHQSQTPCRKKTSQRLTFSKKSRLVSKSQYRQLYKFGKKFIGTTITIDFKLGRSYTPKLGMTVSKKFGKAHDRNRFKRVTREAFRLFAPSLPSALEMNISPRHPLPHVTRADILHDLTFFKETHYSHVKSETTTSCRER